MIPSTTIAGLSARLRRLRNESGDAGQALLLVVIIVALLAALSAGLIGTVDGSLAITQVQVQERAAYAALEAGIQNYRADLNSSTTYYTYGTTEPADPDNCAMGTGNWEEVLVDGVPTTPPEWFHVTPNGNFLGDTSTSSTFADNNVLVTITGAAGGHFVTQSSNCSGTEPGQAGAGRFTYESAVITFKQYATYLQNAYYSDLEVLDPDYPQETDDATSVADPNATVVTTVGGIASTESEPESDVIIPEYTYLSDAGTPVTVYDSTVQTAMCSYTQWQENTFIDSWSYTPSPAITVGSTTYNYTASTNAFSNPFESGSNFSTTYPYYGAYFGVPKTPITSYATSPATDGNWTETAKNYTYSYTTGSVTTTVEIEMAAEPCSTPYDFLGGESFSGPVYSDDELHVCTSSGAPTFAGVPYSLLTGTPSTFAFKYEWPGAVKATTGPNNGLWVPKGYTIDQDNCGTTTPVPTLDGALVEGANEELPSFDNSLIDWADGNDATTTTPATYGCVFTGPTMIELIDTSGTETMDVWSPLSKKTDFSGGSNCGTGKFSPTNAFQTGIALPADDVIYVQNVPSSSSDPNYWSDAQLEALNSSTSISPSDGNTTGATCFLNPEEPDALPATTECDGGTLFIEGEMHGEMTIGADQDVYITRDLSYACADTGGSIQSPSNGLPTACTSGTTPDLLGLYANEDVLFSHPVSSTSANATACSNNGTTSTGTVADVLPNCTTSNAIVDALLIALNGSFGIQNYGEGTTEGDMYLNGADIAEYRGPFGISGTSGYDKVFTYDTRLAYLAPPHAVTTSSSNWYPWGWVNCGGDNLANSTSPSCPGIN